MNDLGRKLRMMRLSRGMTQDDVASKVRITRSTISNYEIGRRTPHFKDLQKLARVFGVGLDYFGIAPKDEAVDLLERAREVFASPNIDRITKDELYLEMMRVYLTQKEKAGA